MGLIDLKTDLKSLKYGGGSFGDRRGGGWSGQPYITTDIPEEPEGARTDFLLRQGALTRSGKDVSRLEKLLTDNKSLNGVGFITKQQLLSSLNPIVLGRPNRQSPISGLYNPANTLAQVAGNVIGLHLEKQGISPIFDSTQKYFNLTKEFNENPTNKLVLLYNNKIQNSPISPTGALLYGIDTLNPNNLFNYIGGPGGVKTTIQITNPTVKQGDTFQNTPDQSRRVTSETTTRVLGLSSKYRNNLDFTGDENIIPIRANAQPSSSINPIIEDPSTQVTTGPSSFPDNLDLPTYEPLNEAEKNIIDAASTYGKSKAVSYRINTSTESTNPNLYTSTNQNDDLENSDIIKFYIEVINNDSLQSEYLYFRAYIDDFGDSFSSTWNDTKYVGRAENFYTYGGFNRIVNLGFTIFAHSGEELIPIYEKLNQLAGIVSPDYSNVGFMRGTYVKLTVGDYLYNVPGIITGFKLDGLLDGGWEIEDGVQLPKHIKVSGMEFKPIHNFVPKKGAQYFDI